MIENNYYIRLYVLDKYCSDYVISCNWCKIKDICNEHELETLPKEDINKVYKELSDNEKNLAKELLYKLL